MSMIYHQMKTSKQTNKFQGHKYSVIHVYHTSDIQRSLKIRKVWQAASPTVSCCFLWGENGIKVIKEDILFFFTPYFLNFILQCKCVK